MNVNEIIDIYKDDIEGAIDTLLTEGLLKIRNARYYDAEPFFEKAYLLSADLIKTENQKETDKSQINQNEMKFADVFSKYTFTLFIQNTKNPLKFIDVVTKFKKQNEETNKELYRKVMEVVLDDCDIFYPRYCSDLNSCFYMTWYPFPYITQKLEADDSGLSLQTLIKYLKILKRCVTSLKNSIITEISCSIMNNFINHYDKDLKNNKKKLRTVDETRFKNFIILLQKFLKGSNLKQLEKFENDVLFDFLMSDFLGKQFYALSRFNSYSTFSKDLTEQFYKRDIINKLLFKTNLHHELIHQFSLFLSKLFEYGFYEDSIIEQLWSKTFEKTDELEDYFNAWPILQSSIPVKNQKFFWKLVLTKTPSFSSIYIRTFLIKIASNCSEKDKIEMVNLLWKSAIESQNSEEFDDVINEYIPNDNDFRTELKKRCFKLFQKNEDVNVIFALKLLIKIWKNAEDENETHEDFDFLLKNCKLTINNATTFLNLLSIIATNFVNPLTEEELELIKNQIVGIISINSIFVFNFIQSLLNTKRGRLFTLHLLFSLLEWMTKLPTVDSVTFKLIRNLYELIHCKNKKRKIKDDTTDYLKKSIDCLWDLLYRADIPDVADFLVKIYMKKCLNFSKKKNKSKSNKKKSKKNSKSSKNKKNNESESNNNNDSNNDFDSTVVNDFINKCFQKLECFGSLTALNFLISEIEDSLNLDKYNIQRNVFNGYKQTLTIHLTKDYIGDISVPEGISYYSFRKMIRDLIKANDYQITLMSGQEKLDRNHVFKHNEKIKVFFNTFEQNEQSSTIVQQKKKNDDNNNNNDDSGSDSSDDSQSISDSSFSFDINSYDIEMKKEDLPSQILDKHRDKIKSLLDSDDTLICEAALNLLNHLSIDENEINLLKTKSDLFDINHPFLFVYRLNLLANLIVIKDFDVLSNIFNSDLYSQLINIVFKMDRNSFTKDEYFDLLLDTVVDINRIGSETKELKKSKRNCMKNLMHDSNSSLTSIMNWIIEEEKIKPVNTVRVIDFLVILSDFIQIDKKLLLDHQKFPEFFDLTLFNENESIRSTFYKVLTYIKTTRIQEFSLSRLSFSRKENCNEYFLLIKRIAKFSTSYENSKFLFETLVDSLNENLFIYKNIKVKTEDQSLIDAARDLCADLAYPDFIKGIIDNLEFIFPMVYERKKKNKEEEEEVDDDEEEEEEKREEDENELIKKPELLIHILVDKIIFNTNRFVYSPSSLLTLVEMILNRFPSLFSPLVKSLTKFNESMGNIKNSYLNLYPNDKKNEKGLNNLGCTCYLNASIQQLFHIKEIRNAIFSYDPHINEKEENEEEENDEISKNWLCQLQLLMANLKYAPLSSIDASGFVNNWKMYGNDPIDPNEQQDAVEFLQILLDRLDESIPGKPISKCVRGQIMHTIKQIKGDFQSQSYEDFITFTLEVINKKNFSESFDAFLEPDIFDGDNKYNVEEIGQIDAARYHAIKKAPEILIFQLKRFDFDLSSLTRKKINTEYQISMDVDISRLLWNNDKSQPCIYELFGIIEHSGGAEGGHYISFIKSSDVETESENESHFSWKVYNDSRVSDIDEKEVIKSATGGVYTRRFFDPITQTVKTLQSTKIDSAYILFYRKKNKDIKKKRRRIDSESEEEESENENNSSNENDQVDLDYPIQFMPEIMLRKFFNNMKNLILRHVLFSNEYIKFMDYISTVDNSSTFSFIYQYTMKSIVSSSNGFKSTSIIKTAMNKAQNDINFARYILKKKDNLLINALINFNQEKEATISCELANAAITVINQGNKEKHIYNEDAEFIDSIIESKDELISHTDKFDFVFRPFFYYLKLEDVSIDLSKKYLNFFMDLLESIDKRDKKESVKNQRNKFGKYKSTVISSKSDGSDTNIGIEEAQKKMNVSFVKESNQINLHSRIDFKNINMNYVFKSILILIEKNDFEKDDKDYYHSIKTKVIDADFMNLWSQSRYHAFNFNSLIIHFLKDDKKLTNKYFDFLCKANEILVENDEADDESNNNDSDKKSENEIKTKGKVKFNLSKKSKNKNKNKNHHHHHHGNEFASQNNLKESARKGSQKMTIQKLSAIFINLLTFRDSLTSYRIQWFFEFTEKLKWSHVECGNFLRESSSSIKEHYKELNVLSTSSTNLNNTNEKQQIIIDSYPLFDKDSPYLIKKFLLSEDQFIRSACLTFIYSIFPSFPRVKVQNGNVYIDKNLTISNSNSNINNDSMMTCYNFNQLVSSNIKFVKESESKAGQNVKEGETEYESDSGDSDASEHSVHNDESKSSSNNNSSKSNNETKNDHFLSVQKNCELQAMIKLFNVLMNMIKEVANLSKDIAASIDEYHGFKAIPTDSFFELLSWCCFHLIDFSNIALEGEEELNILKPDEIEFLNNFDLSKYSNLFSDLVVKFSSFRNNVRSSIIDLLRFIYIVFIKTNNINDENSKKSKNNKNKNLIIDQSNSLVYLNAVSHFPSGLEMSIFVDNATVYLIPVITPFADKIESHILKSKFIEMSLKSSICSKSFTDTFIKNINQTHPNAGIEENYYNNSNISNGQKIPGNVGNVISEFLKKLKISEKLCSFLWKKRKPTAWGRSSLLLEISIDLFKNGGFQAVNYFTELGCINSIITEFEAEHEIQQLNFFTWEAMLKLIHLYNRFYIGKQNGEDIDDEVKDEPEKDDESGEVKSSENNKNGKNSKSSHNFLKKFTKNFTELWKANFKFLSIVNGYMTRGVQNYNKIAIKVVDDVVLKGGQISSEISNLGVKLISNLPDHFYASLGCDEICEKYAKMEIEIIHRNRSKSGGYGEKEKKSKNTKSQPAASTASSSSSFPVSSASVSSFVEREARRMIQTKLFNSDLFELFVNEIRKDELKGQLLIEYLTNFDNLSQINDRFISESIEFLRKSGYKERKIEKEEESDVMSKGEVNNADKSESETEIDCIVKNVNGLIEKVIIHISRMINSEEATEIMEKLVLAEKFMDLLRESFGADTKFIPRRKKGIEKAVNELDGKRHVKEIYEQLFRVVIRILPNNVDDQKK